MKKVAIFHTAPATLASMQALAAKIMPDVEVMHIVEDSMIKEVMKNGGLTASISARIAAYVSAAEKAGCQIFMTACSSIGEAVESCRFLTDMTVTRIDDAMAAEAVSKGKKIAVLATVETTLKPTVNLIVRKASEKSVTIDLQQYLMPDAFTALLAGDNAKHDEIVRAALKKAAVDSDVIVLAQASMASVLEGLEGISVPVLTSPERGMKRLKELADKLD